MPITPSSYATNTPITAHQFNQDLYSIDASFFNANGVLFHSNRPMLLESYRQNTAITAAKGGTINVLGGTVNSAFCVLDTASLFGTGSDAPGASASFLSAGAVAPSSSGNPGEGGGWGLYIAFIPLGPFSSTAGTYGVTWIQRGVPNEPLLDIGVMTTPSNVFNNCGFAVDMLERTSLTRLLAPGVFAQDANGNRNALVVNTVSTVGQTPRFSEIWCGVLNGYGTQVNSLPSPFTAVTGLTNFSSSTLNTTINQVFSLLNNPPMLNVELQSTGGITANVVTTVPFTVTPVLDSYSNFSTASTSYTVPLTGMYFCHANIIYATSFNSGEAVAGFQVGSTNFFGGSYNATPNSSQNTGASVTKFLDLQAGDVVKVVTVTSATTAFGTANISHFIMSWMANINSGVQHWTPPDVTGFQLAAGTPPESVTTMNSNPYFAFNNSSGWAATNGTFSVVSSPAAGAYYQYAGQYVNNGSAAGWIGNNGSQAFVTPGQAYYWSGWVHASASPVVAGFGWTLNGTAATFATTSVTVPTNVWTQINVALTAPTSAACNQGYPIVGTSTGNGATVQTQAVLMSDQQALSPILNQKLANDINFLFNKPYFTSHQTTTTSSAANAMTSPTMHTVAGLVHASFGDNYNGWNSGSNKYVAQVPGWYLAVEEISAATISTANSGNSLAAGFSVATSGGIAAPSSPQGMPDWYQQLMVCGGWTYPTGATAIGTYYLQAGEAIAPSAKYLSGTATTWSTDTSHGFASHFSVCWMSN